MINRKRETKGAGGDSPAGAGWGEESRNREMVITNKNEAFLLPPNLHPAFNMQRDIRPQRPRDAWGRSARNPQACWGVHSKDRDSPLLCTTLCLALDKHLMIVE